MATENNVTQAIGVPGLKLWGNTITQEWMPDLVDRSKRYKVFQEMERDSTVSALLKAIIMPLLAAEFDVEPPPEADETDEKNAEFIWSAIDDMNDYTWRKHVRDQLSSLTYGWAVSEIVCKKRLGMDAEVPSLYNDGLLGLKILAPRGQNTLSGWKMTPEYDIEAMMQTDPNTYQPLEIPKWKLIHTAFNARNQNPEGLSPLMECYKAWRYKTNLEAIEGIGIERDLAGLPVIRLPYNATAADVARAQEIVNSVRMDEQAGLVLPAPKTPDKDAQKWEFSLVAAAGGKQYDADTTINRYVKQILMTFFAQFLALGMDKVGTQALVEGSQDFFTLALVGVQQEFVETWNAQLVPFLYRINNLPHPRGFVKLVWHPPGQSDITSMVANIKGLVEARILTPEPDTEDFMRGMMGLPDRPEGVGEGDRSPLLPAGMPTGLPSDTPSDTAPSAGTDAAENIAEGEKLNGIQVQASVQVVQGFINGQIPETVALELLVAVGINRDRASAMVKACRRFDPKPVEEPAGEFAQKPKRGTLHRSTEEYRKQIIKTYHSWAEDMAGKLDTMGGSKAEKMREVDRGLPELLDQLKAMGEKRLRYAFVLAARGREPSERAEKMLAAKIAENTKYLSESLIPDIRKRLEKAIDEKTEAKQYAVSAVLLSLLGMESRVAMYPGAYRSTFWEITKVFGREEDEEAKDRGEKVRPVRWVLGDGNPHCEDCLRYQGEYDSWSDLPAVPGGDCRCLVNCTCQLLVWEDGEWVSVAA